MASGIERISSGAPWEREVGYCRAVRFGDTVVVSGTTAVGPDGEILALGDAYGQARQAIALITQALGELGLVLDAVVRTRIYLTDRNNFSDVARAHEEAFGAHPPASTAVVVAALIDPRMLVEIEALAWDSPAAV